MPGQLSVYKVNQGRYTRSITAVGLMVVMAALCYYGHTLLNQYVRTDKPRSMPLGNVDESWILARSWPSEASPKYAEGSRITAEMKSEMQKAGVQKVDVKAARPFPLAMYIQLGVPAILFVLGGIGTFLAVNYPRFADFLIATEGEMKKVSWSTKEELVGSTVVVLITVVFLSAVIFVADTVWIWSFSFVGAYGGK